MTHEDDLRAQAGVREGEILAGKYRVDRVLGVGGMGVVVAAHHLDLDSPVAVKFVLPALLGEREAMARFAREARAAARISNEHVARVFDVGTLANGAPYMVMEFLEGEDLGQWIHRRGPLPVEQAVEFVLQACVALAEAHRLGVVHRDLKPANLFCVRRSDGQLLIKVLDFGISKVATGGRPEDAAVTRTSAVMGSPAYMSPEQVQNAKDVDARTDVWSLGVVLFELLSAQQPFPGESLAEIAVKIAITEPVALRTVRPDVPAVLEAVIRRCLEKDRARRFASVVGFARALLPCVSSRGATLVDRVAGIAGEAEEMAAPAAAVEGPTAASDPGVSPRTPAAGVSPRTLTAVQDSSNPRGSLPGVAGSRRAAILVASAGALGAVALAVAAFRHPPAEPASPALPPGTASAGESPPSEEPVRLPALPERASGALSYASPSSRAVAAPSPVAKPPGESTKGAAGALSGAYAAPPGPAPSAAHEASQVDAAALPRSARLTINSLPPSVCFLDGERLGATPRVQLAVTPGLHVVTFVETGSARSKTVSVVAAAGETTYATGRLEDTAAEPPDGGP